MAFLTKVQKWLDLLVFPTNLLKVGFSRVIVIP